MAQLFSNNANTTLASPISSGATTIIVATGTGALFPNPGLGQYFTLTLNDQATGQVYEICYCTARTGDSLTVTRGQEGTTAVAWLLGDFAYNAWTAATSAIATNPAGIQALSSSGTFTVPADVYEIDVELWSGGGGGGGAFNNGYSGGGTGGGYARNKFVVTPGQTIDVTIGAGGAAGNGSPSNGSDGGASLFGGYMTVPGGPHGLAANGVTAGPSASGASPTGGAINIAGQNGSGGNDGVGGGSGGQAPMGGGSAPAGSTGGTGSSGLFPGSGGGGTGAGASAGYAGGTGAGGLCIVTWE
jgi:hypothetical protein